MVLRPLKKELEFVLHGVASRVAVAVGDNNELSFFLSFKSGTCGTSLRTTATGALRDFFLGFTLLLSLNLFTSWYQEPISPLVALGHLTDRVRSYLSFAA